MKSYAKLPIVYPVIQAPMAGGIISADFTAEICNQGMLGSIAAGMLSPEQLSHEILKVQQLTQHVFQVNLFAHSMPFVDEHLIELTNVQLNNIRQTLSIPVISHYDFQTPDLEEMVDVCITHNVPIVSFTFGCPARLIKRLKEHGIIVIGTATTVKEAQAFETSGADFIVVQGIEAGGHQGGFLDESSQPLNKILIDIKSAVDTPLIAAGGLNDRQSIDFAFNNGADYIQIGTRFLNTYESIAHPLHKEAINTSNSSDTIVTNCLTGKKARGIHNEMIELLASYEIPSYPLMNMMTKDIRAAAKAQNNEQFMSNWSGQNIDDITTQPLQEVIDEIKAIILSL